MASDEDLVLRVAAGNQAALAALLSRWDGPLAAFVSRHTGGSDVEDLRQETWMRVVRAADRFQPGKKFSTWLFAIALNLCRDWSRKRPQPTLEPRAVARALDSGAQSAAALPDPGVPVGLEAEELLAALPENLRSALVLRYYHDLSEAEMAEVLAVPRGTVKSRLHHAIRKLMELYRSS